MSQPWSLELQILVAILIFALHAGALWFTWWAWFRLMPRISKTINRWIYGEKE